MIPATAAARGVRSGLPASNTSSRIGPLGRCFPVRRPPARQRRLAPSAARGVAPPGRCVSPRTVPAQEPHAPVMVPRRANADRAGQRVFTYSNE
jgi:hypothetical protein